MNIQHMTRYTILAEGLSPFFIIEGVYAIQNHVNRLEAIKINIRVDALQCLYRFFAGAFYHSHSLAIMAPEQAESDIRIKSQWQAGILLLLNSLHHALYRPQLLYPLVIPIVKIIVP